MSQKPSYATFLLNKLVRDLAPARFGSKGDVLHHHAVTGPALEKALLAKLMEEAEEVKAALEKSERTEELADLLEVMLALAAFWDISWDDIEAKRLVKKNVLGGFEKGLFGTHCDIPVEHEAYLSVLRAQPEKYKEITQPSDIQLEESE